MSKGVDEKEKNRGRGRKRESRGQQEKKNSVFLQKPLYTPGTDQGRKVSCWLII